MDTPERFALTNFTDLLRQGHDPDSARTFLTQVGMQPELIDRAITLYTDLARGIRDMREPRVLADGTRVPDPWYTGPSEKDIHWPALRKHLESKPMWNGTPLETLDQASSKIVANLEPPYAREIRTRGLVVGYVQSGKTSNFTAVVSKAADTGYRLFVVLSGLHNNLRRQTQVRLNEQLIDLNSRIWVPLTNEESDFGSPIRATPLLAHKDLRLLAVVKKNGTRLRNLISWLQGAHDDRVLEHCPVLIIDDEADQASPNTGRAAEERATINGLIIQLLGFPRAAYVGYTATPFANFFIDPDYPEDLYPRHFIVDLPRSPDYFGPESLFGRELRSAEDPEPQTFDMIREVDVSELSSLVPPGRGSEPFRPAVTHSLRAAIRWFLLAATARRIRDGESRHTSMLIHTSERVAVHDLLWQPVVDEIQAIDAGLVGDYGIGSELADMWEEETMRVDPSAWDHPSLAASDVIPEVPHTIDLLGNLGDREAEDCGVVVDNSFSPKRLLYDDENPVPVIVIGGNTLSRGLTLEGLVSSFFVRRAGTYDTLLQMGRWFGYRRGYEDLPRMWVTAVLKNRFRYLAGVEQQIREEVERYESEGLTPAEVPVRVQTNPAIGMAITSKLGAARDLKMSYSGQRPQTILFRTDPDWLRRNLGAGRSLVKTARAVGSDLFDDGNRLVLRDAGVDLILEFLGDGGYQFHENNAELRRDTLIGYIRAQNDLGELMRWNIVIVSRLDSPFGDVDLAVDRPVNLIGRSKLVGASTEDTANIGILTNQVDWVADLDIDKPSAMSLPDLRRARTASGRAVLLLYPVARNSPARTAEGGSIRDKSDLDLEVDVLGVAIAFPEARHDPTPQNYKAVVLPSQLGPDIGSEEAEEAADFDEDSVAIVEGDDGEGSLDDPREAG